MDSEIKEKREFYSSNFLNEHLHMIENKVGIKDWFKFHDDLKEIAPNKAKMIYGFMELTYQKKKEYIDGKIPFSEFESAIQNWFYYSWINYEGILHDTQKFHGSLC